MNLVSGQYEKLSFKELLDEYFEARLDYEKAVYRSADPEITSILIQNYQEYEVEIERRMFEYESCKE